MKECSQVFWVWGILQTHLAITVAEENHTGLSTIDKLLHIWKI